MNRIIRKDKVSREPRARAPRSLEWLIGTAVLSMLLGTSSCTFRTESEEKEPVGQISQNWGPDGENGIPPDVLIGGYLSRLNTNKAGVTSVADPQLASLCGIFDGINCDLNAVWENWLNPTGAYPPDSDTVLRGHILASLAQGTMPKGVVVHLPGGVDVEGRFGMYPDWAILPLGVNEQQTMSGFIAMKVNAFGATVPVGIVGPDPGPEAPKPVDDPRFTYQEGVFFGNLFGTKPGPMMACIGSRAVTTGTVAGQALRVCSDLGNPCNVDALGPCADWCDSWAGVGVPTGEYCESAHDAAGGVWTFPLTVYMRVDP